MTCVNKMRFTLILKTFIQTPLTTLRTYTYKLIVFMHTIYSSVYLLGAALCL